jgi:hypothetical protein
VGGRYRKGGLGLSVEEANSKRAVIREWQSGNGQSGDVSQANREGAVREMAQQGIAQITSPVGGSPVVD